MKWRRSIFSTFFFVMLTSVIITGLIIGGFWIRQSNAFYKTEVDRLKIDYIEIQKSLIEHEVNAVINDIDYRTQHAMERLKKDAKMRVYEAYDVGINLYEEYKNEKSPEEIQTMIKHALRDLRFNESRGYYFADTLKGDVILYPVKPELEGTNIYDLEDQRGTHVIQDEIRTVTQENEGFVEGYWTKPDAGTDESYLKVSFVKYFEPFDWYIGTGEYLDDVMADIRGEAFQRYTQYRYGEADDRYIFISSYQGKELVNGMYPEYVGQDLWDLKDKNGLAVVQEEVEKAIENPDGAYIQHFWKKIESQEEAEKLTFVKAYPPWQIIVGTGIDLETIEKTLNIQKQEIDKETWQRMLNIIALIFIILLGSILFIKYIENAAVKSFNTFYDFFEKAVYKKEPIAKKELNFSEFKVLADAANQMLEEQRKADEALQRLNENLEHRVEERTLELEASMKKLIETQNLLVKNEKLSLIGGLVTGLTHELDDPLGITLSLVSNVERLTRGLVEKKEEKPLTKEELEEYFVDVSEELHLSMKNLRKTISIIDHFKQISLDQSQDEKQVFELCSFIDEQIRSIKEKFDRPQIHVQLICEGGIEVYSNPSDYAQIMNNLFVNAYIHGFDYDSHGEITIEVIHNESRLLLLFNDNGKGISEEDMQRIFEPFFTTRKEEGQSGLGLNIVYDLVTNKLNGNLNVSSREGYGTEYKIEIPLKNDVE